LFFAHTFIKPQKWIDSRQTKTLTN